MSIAAQRIDREDSAIAALVPRSQLTTGYRELIVSRRCLSVIGFSRTSLYRPLSYDERPQRTEDLRFQRPDCRKKLKGMVASPWWAAAWPA